MKRQPETTYEQMGRAALLPGMQYLIERMQAELDAMREQLHMMQNGAAPVKRGRGRPRNNTGNQHRPSGLPPKGTPARLAYDNERKRRWQQEHKHEPVDRHYTGALGWARFKTKAARSAEMKRRLEMRKLQRQQENLSRAARVRWDKKTPAQRKEWLAKMQAGKAAAA